MENMVQMKYLRLETGEMRKVQLINFGEFESPIFQNFFKGGLLKPTERFSSPSIIIDQRELKDTWKKIQKDWFGGEGSVRSVLVSGGIFWGIFLSYIFPVLLDIAKVFCAFKVAQAFYEERSGSTGRDGKSGFQSLVYYGKWYLAFWMIPWGVELIDQFGGKMYNDLMSKKIIPTS